MNVRINNYSRLIPAKGKRSYYNWRVFVDDPVALETIERVEYFLHPSFPEPYHVRNDKVNKFALENQGWGEFDLGIWVKFKNDEEELVHYHLVLDPKKKPWPKDLDGGGPTEQ